MKTDSELKQDVLAELKWEPSINAAHIGVEVEDGVVTLAGHVDSFAEKWAAEVATQRVTGVKALAVEIDVRLAGSAKRNDGDIARSAANILDWTASLPKDSVKVLVQDGWVTLTGAVSWEFQRQAADAAVRHLMGVTGLSNNIVLDPAVSLSVVKSDIEAALKRRATTDARHIEVEVHGTDVTLTGTVHSWSERDLAMSSAWGTPGVKNVVDRLTTTY